MNEMEDIKKKSLIDALQTFDLRELPEKEDGENVWIRALALAQKSDGTENYIYVEKNQELNNRIVQDFGKSSVIRRVVEYYPFSYLKEANMPKFSSQRKEDRIEYLKRNGVDGDFTETSLKELNTMVMWNAIQRQLKKEKENYKIAHLDDRYE